MSSWESYLKQFEEEFQSAETGTFDQLPDGKYQAQIDGACLKTSKKGDPMVEFILIITDGEYQRRKEWKYHLLKPGNIKYLKWDLNTLGLELDAVTDLPRRLMEGIGQFITLEITTKIGRNGKEFRNLYIKKPQPQSTNSLDDPFADDGKPIDLPAHELPF